MIYVKSVLVGMVTAVAGTILWLMAEIGLGSLMIAREMARSTGSGGIGAVSIPSYALVGGFLGFAIGFLWNVRRLKKKQIR